MDTCVIDMGDGSVMCPNCHATITEVRAEEDELPKGIVSLEAADEMMDNPGGYLEFYCPECGEFVRLN